MPNSSPPKLEDSLGVENPLAGMLKSAECGSEAGSLTFAEFRNFGDGQAPARRMSSGRGRSEWNSLKPFKAD